MGKRGKTRESHTGIGPLPVVAVLLGGTFIGTEYVGPLLRDASRWALSPAAGYARPISLQGIDGRMRELKPPFRKPVLLNFWEGNCRFCIDELSRLSQFARDYDSIDIYTITSDMNGYSLKHMRERPLGLTVLLDRQRTAYAAYDVKAVPTTYLLGRDGKILYQNDRVTDFSPHSPLRLVLGK